MSEIKPEPPAVAHVVGTVNAIDRSKQYTRADNEELLRSLNQLWKEKRLLDTAVADRDRQIATLHGKLKERDDLIVELKKHLGSKFWANVVTALISAGVALAWEIGMLFAPMLLRYFGFN